MRGEALALPAFRRKLAVVRAGVDAEAAGSESWQQALALSGQLADDVQGVFLVLARAAQRKYDLPVIEMSQSERAELLYTMALAAIKQGDVSVGKGLLQAAIDTHPQYFEAATRSLAALDANVQN